MMGEIDDPIVVCIIFRQSLNLDNIEIACYTADAIQHILLKYFTLQVLAVKTSSPIIKNDSHLENTSKWLSSHSKKNIHTVNEEVWNKIITEFYNNKSCFFLKNSNTETGLVFYPRHCSIIPQFN